MTARGWLLRALYGATFVAGVPILLMWWARATEAVVPLRTIQSMPVGVTLIIAGALLMAAGARALIVLGHGLPMNAFPPSRFVREGVYRWVRNPMYLGFGLACAGMALATGSASGFWLVTPVAALASAALVWGFERPDLARRFGPDASEPPLLSFPRGGDEPPAIAHRAAVFLWVLIPWVATWFAAQAIGRAPDVFETALPFERTWPVWQWTELFYVTAYVFIPITALIPTSERSLRRLAVSGSIATIIVTLCWFTIPVVAANRPFTPTGVLGEILAREQGHSVGVAAFPAFHVLWALLAATAWRNKWIGWSWAVAITLSCLTTAMHTLVEVGAAILLYLPLRDPAATWAWIRARAEAHANSWREWRVGPLRIINHGAYAAAAGCVGFIVLAVALPEGGVPAALWVFVCTVVGAGIWAQFLEGSSMLLRPFGWYGGVAGGIVGAVTAPWFGVPVMAMGAALSIAAPWIQSIGRLRCLVQGCCHGGIAPGNIGIRYRHRRSRVTHIAHLRDRPVHPTPLYSIAANIVIGVILLRLRSLGARDVLVTGLYLILGGLARFVEEGYRAEPQTPIVGGLHSYQWIAIGSLLAGMWITTLPVTSAALGFSPLTWPIAIAALGAGGLTGIAMGVDVPGSNRRFSRLAPAD
ncbi:MAG: prolipoprotein diacylglyceryl transferase family protein [Vicinamibacterales bacterium]